MQQLLPVVTATVRSLKMNPEAMTGALSEDLLATDLADYLVRKGLPFRQAHHVVGEIVQMASEAESALSQLPLSRLRQVSPAFDDDVREVFDFSASVARRRALGGTAPAALQMQIERARAKLSS